MRKDVKPKVYYEGRVSRNRGHTRAACKYNPSTQMHLRSWWLAGWHDKDMELEGKAA